MQYGCLVFAGILFLIVGIVGSVFVRFWMNIVRYEHVVRVCSGDFLIGEGPKQKVKVFPYMKSSGNLLWYATMGKGTVTYSGRF